MKNKLFLIAMVFIFVGFVANVQAQEVKPDKKVNTEKKIKTERKTKVEKKEVNKAKLEKEKKNAEKGNMAIPEKESEEKMYEETRGEPVPGAAVYIEEEGNNKLAPTQNSNKEEGTETEKPNNKPNN